MLFIIITIQRAFAETFVQLLRNDSNLRTISCNINKFIKLHHLDHSCARRAFAFVMKNIRLIPYGEKNHKPN